MAAKPIQSSRRACAFAEWGTEAKTPITTRIPMGRLNRNTQGQEYVSVT